MSECTSLSQAVPIRLEGWAVSLEGKLRVALGHGFGAHPLPGADSALEEVMDSVSLSVKRTKERASVRLFVRF